MRRLSGSDTAGLTVQSCGEVSPFSVYKFSDVKYKSWLQKQLCGSDKNYAEAML